MASPFLTEDFLLDNERARTLFHTVAAGLPIIDYHCHIPPADVASDRRFANLTQIWLAGDHYKWRAMRACGVEERFITGDASDREKFQRWAETVPQTLRNPLYHWTHLELRRPFGIADQLLDGSTAQGIWDECNALLATPSFSVRGIQKQMRVEVVCTTDDPADGLEHHRTVAADPECPVSMYPTFRPDRAMAVEDPTAFGVYLEALGRAADIEIDSFHDLLVALARRHDVFHALGCRLSDHGLEEVPSGDYTERQLDRTFTGLLRGKVPDPPDAAAFKSALLEELAVMDWRKGWVQQFHIGALRNTNSRMRRALGPDTGYDSIGDREMARPLARFLDRLDNANHLAKTILYNLNPRDNELFASMIGNFQDGSVPGKIQYGSAWWFLDQRDGMTRQIEALSTMGLLSRFVGMLTDSRSFLSYPRHEYFRRILCNILGAEMERGVIPDDMALVGGMVRDICYENARRFFGFLRYDEKAAAPGTAGRNPS